MKFFISYSRSVKGDVEPIVEVLRSSNHEVWWDAEIPSMDDWWATILANIEWCEVFVFMVTEKSVQSPYCRAELRYARDRNRPILPYMLDDPARMSYDLPQELRRRQWLRHNSDLSRILENINRDCEKINWEKHKDIQVPRPPEPNTGSGSLVQRFHQAEHLANDGHFDEAINRLHDVASTDENEWGDRCRRWIARLQSYREIAELTKHESTHERALDKWTDFQQHYADVTFDPLNVHSKLSYLFPVSFQSDIINTPTTTALIPESAPKHVQDMVRTLLTTWNPDVKTKALELLGNQRIKVAIPAIGHILNEDEDWKVRIEAAKSLEKIGDRDAIHYMRDALSDENASVRNAVAKRLGTIGGEEVIDDLTSILNDPVDIVSKAAAQTLLNIGSEKAITHAIKYHIERTRVDVNGGILNNLNKVGEPAINPLIRFLKSEDPFEREQAAKLSRYFPNPSMENALIERINDDVAQVVVWALNSLTAVNPQVAQPHLLDHIRHSDFQIRDMSAAMLGSTTASDEIILALRTALNDDHKNVRKSARYALGKLGVNSEAP